MTKDDPNIGPHLSLDGWRGLFPDPNECSEQQLRWETALIGMKLVWAAITWNWTFVCVYAFRLKEIGEENTGKPFNHGDHVSWYAQCKRGLK